MNPKVSFVIVSHNSEKYIIDCLKSILQQSEKNHEIIVIDNDSKDSTTILLQNFNKTHEIKLILNPTNLGYGNALSIGIVEAKGEYIAILNADVILDQEWATNLLRTFLIDDKIALAHGKILLPSGEVQSTGGIMDKYGAVIQRDNKLTQSLTMNKITYFYNDGSSFMVKRKIFNEINFDSKLFLYYEDVDLSWKIRMLNYKIQYSEKAKSYHHVGHSDPSMTLSKFYYISRNRMYTCMKNYSKKNILTRIPVMIVLVFLDSIYYDISKKPRGYTKLFLKALWWNIINMGYTRKENKKLRAVNRISDSELDQYILAYSVEFKLLKKI